MGVIVLDRYRKKSSIPLASLKSDESTDSNSLSRKTTAFNNNNKASNKIACLKVVPPLKISDVTEEFAKN